jgi:hypothetical protein
MGFLDNYEGNKERTDRWIKTYPEGRLEATIVNFDPDKGSILVRAAAWRNQTEIEPAGIDFAFGYQAAYNANMKRWFVEDTVTSALMRVMALVMGGTEKATKETMEKVNAADVYDPWATKFGDVPSYKTSAEAEMAGTPSFGSSFGSSDDSPAAPECHHGPMRWNQSKPDAPKSWGGYFCSEKLKEHQCTPRWYVLRSTGKWEPQV